MLHIVSGIHFITDYPVGHKPFAAGCAGISLRQKRTYGRQILLPRLITSVKGIIRRTSQPGTGHRVNQLGIGGNIVQKNSRHFNSLRGENTEYQIVFRHHLAVERITFSPVIILNGGMNAIGRIPQDS